MNESRKSGKCTCLDHEPQKCYELKLMKIGKKPVDINAHHLCSCYCHVDYIEGDTDQIKGGC
jgi:hypothetical protein